MASEAPPPAPSDLPDAEPDEQRMHGEQSVQGSERRVDGEQFAQGGEWQVHGEQFAQGGERQVHGEQFGTVEIARHRKDDGRALILYTHREREQP